MIKSKTEPQPKYPTLTGIRTNRRMSQAKARPNTKRPKLLFCFSFKLMLIIQGQAGDGCDFFGRLFEIGQTLHEMIFHRIKARDDAIFAIFDTIGIYVPWLGDPRRHAAATGASFKLRSLVH